MNPEVKKQWVAALRSGEYAQGQSSLRNYQDKYCCLGVLCELAVSEGIIPAAREEVGSNHYFYGKHDGMLPLPVHRWAGSPDQHFLIQMNDVDRVSFQGIADYIEENL